MKALTCGQWGPLEDLYVGAWPEPAASPGTVVIRVDVAAINPPDVFMPQGKYHVRPPLPFVPGVEAMGRVAKVGSGVTEFSVGDRVMTYAGIGCFGDMVAVAASRACRVPAEMSDEVAAGFLLVNGTAYHAVLDSGRLETGQTLIVLGASGGIGLAAIQIAKALGARVIAVASSQEKLDVCSSVGADVLVNRKNGDLTDMLKSATCGEGADVILDTIGGEATEQAMRAIRPFGRYVLAGAAKGELPLVKGSLIILKQVELVGSSFRLLLERFPERAGRNLEKLCKLWANGALKPHVGAQYARDQILDALRLVEAGEAIGKVVVRHR